MKVRYLKDKDEKGGLIMALALKCDICGNFYDRYNTNAQDNNGGNSFAYFNLVRIGGQDGYHKNGHYIDCCPECMESITNHISRLRERRNCNI